MSRRTRSAGILGASGVAFALVASTGGEIAPTPPGLIEAATVPAEISARLRAHGYEVEEPPRGRRQNKATSPAGIHFEINTPPYTKTDMQPLG